MEIVREVYTDVPPEEAVALMVDRLTLAKRRWRAVAEDGRVFGFDLEKPALHGDRFGSGYVIFQKAEPVLEMRSAEPARLGWLLGNLHFPIEIDGDVIRVADDDAVRQMLEREKVACVAVERVFRPMAGGHRHE